MDIEDLSLACRKEPRKCAEMCRKNKAKPCHIRSGSKQWFKVTELSAIFETLATVGNDTYMLVAGNTGHGL